MDDWDALPISLLAQAGYCIRRAALLTNEQAWADNADTAKGRLEHERVHSQRVERRGDRLKLFDYPVFSRMLGINGKCDCIEATGSENGCHIPAADFPVKLYPVEYKHGVLRKEEEYEIQLCAQAMCLEEMYKTKIEEGAIFYISSHRRETVSLTDSLRQKVQGTIRLLEEMRRSFKVPVAEYGPKCIRCSLRDICMPQTPGSAAAYCKQVKREAEEVDY